MNRMRDKKELWFSFAAVAMITIAYLGYVVVEGRPQASGFWGHSLGVIGFLLMLSTETLYSLRKRALRRPWGRLRDWLRAHIFSGIVGPYLVLLHTAWEFRGLAGIVLLLTSIVVLSGFIGRYIYTSVPRTADGMIFEQEVVTTEIEQLEGELRKLETSIPGSISLTGLLPSAARISGTLTNLRSSYQRRRLFRQLDPQTRAVVEKAIEAALRRNDLERSLSALANARRLLAVWHRVHIPLGIALFVSAFIHIGAALYYATLSR